MPEPLWVVGAGGFGRETVDVAEAMLDDRGEPRFTVVGVADDGPSEIDLTRLAARGLTHLGTADEAHAAYPDARYAIGVGAPATRRAIAERLEAAGARPATLVHPSVTIGSVNEIGEGAVLCAGAKLTTNITLGRHVHMNASGGIGHDSVIGDHVTIGPYSMIAGSCTLADEVLIGAGAMVLAGLTLGRGSVVGACACVVRDVDAATVVKGIPAR